MAEPAGTPHVDAGRLVVVVLFCLSIIGLVAGLPTALRSGAGPADTVLEAASRLVTLAFLLLMVRAYLRRGPALATARDLPVRLAAPLATWLPLTLPWLPLHAGGTARPLAALALTLAGTTWSVWSVRHLSTCLSLVPQARRLVDTGPYRFVRHPLYLGEIIALGGIALRGGTWAHLAVLLVVVALQLYRARAEEGLLAQQVPGYVTYAARTWRVLPGLV